MLTDSSTRLNKYISESGICSRREANDLVLIALNKPVGIVSTTEDGECDNIVDFVNHSLVAGQGALSAASGEIHG